MTWVCSTNCRHCALYVQQAETPPLLPETYQTLGNSVQAEYIQQLQWTLAIPGPLAETPPLLPETFQTLGNSVQAEYYGRDRASDLCHGTCKQ